MASYKCIVCEFIYDEDQNDQTWAQLAADWVCPVCESPKKYYELEADTPEAAEPAPTEASQAGAETLLRPKDEFEIHMADIHQMAATGEAIIEPMRTQSPTISWDELLIKGGQLARLPLNQDSDVDLKVVIGPGARQPLTIDMPILISHMSFGAISKEAKIALARGSAVAGTAICSGEGGILPESRREAHRYIFEYVPNRYSVTEENLRAADAIEIKIGQSAKPGMGGHLPEEKVTAEIAQIRGFATGQAITSPAHFEDIKNGDDLKRKVAWLRETSGGRPIGIKLAAGHIEADLAIALQAGPDFITIDGRAGATGAAPKFVKAATSIPTLFALYRARRYLDRAEARDVSLIITGGTRTPADFVKALALGADAVAIGTAALMAIGCQQYRICHSGKCPMGIATQDPGLRKNLNVDRAAEGLANFLKATRSELVDFTRLTGNSAVHALSWADLSTTNAEISNHTAIEHVSGYRSE